MSYDFSSFIEMGATAIGGGLVSQLIAWAKFDKSLALLKASVLVEQEACAACRARFELEDSRLFKNVEAVSEMIRTHAESLRHYTDQDRRLNDQRWDELGKRLVSIEEYLRNGHARRFSDTTKT